MRLSFAALIYENVNKTGGLEEPSSYIYNMCFNFKARWFSHRKNVPVVV